MPDEVTDRAVIRFVLVRTEDAIRTWVAMMSEIDAKDVNPELRTAVIAAATALSDVVQECLDQAAKYRIDDI